MWGYVLLGTFLVMVALVIANVILSKHKKKVLLKQKKAQEEERKG